MSRTAPQIGSLVGSLRFAFSSCQQINDSLYVAHRAAADEPDLDFFMHLGDYIYESSHPRFRIRSHDAAPPRTLDEYRARYALYKTDPMLQRAHEVAPRENEKHDGDQEQREHRGRCEAADDGEREGAQHGEAEAARLEGRVDGGGRHGVLVRGVRWSRGCRPRACRSRWCRARG